MIKLRQLIEAARLLRAGTELGDGAVLKADALGARASRDAEAKLERVRGYLPPIDLDALARLPKGSFGHEYARFMREKGLSPFRVSSRIDAEMLRRNVFAVRYAVTHDIVHVLLGFNTRYPGEMGVIAFAAAQGYSFASKVGLVLATVLYPLLSLREAGETFRALRRGYRLGKAARFVLGVRFEERWAEPLTAVRRDLGLPERIRASDPAVDPVLVPS